VTFIWNCCEGKIFSFELVKKLEGIDSKILNENGFRCSTNPLKTAYIIHSSFKTKINQLKHEIKKLSLKNSQSILNISPLFAEQGTTFSVNRKVGKYLNY
jgi:hypothetical protein